MAQETMYEMKLQLRPGKSTDFVGFNRSGEKQYLFGKLFAIRHKENEWSFKRFGNSKAAIIQFNECFKRDMVWVIANADNMGVLDEAPVVIGELQNQAV